MTQDFFGSDFRLVFKSYRTPGPSKPTIEFLEMLLLMGESLCLLQRFDVKVVKRQNLYKCMSQCCCVSEFQLYNITTAAASTNLLQPSKAKSEIIGHFLMEWKKHFISGLKWSSFFKMSFKSSWCCFFQLKCKLVTIGTQSSTKMLVSSSITWRES